MRKIDALLSEYGESHQNGFNKMVHWVCVPVIFFSIVGLIWSIPPDPLQGLLDTQSPWVNWATLTLLIASLYYFTLSVPLALGMLVVAFTCCLLANTLADTLPIDLWLFSVILFVLAWIGQFYGHQVEGKKPSFLKDVQFLMIGPAWLMHFIFKKVGIKY